MENLEQLQLVVGEVQAARQQVSSVRAQVQELQGQLLRFKTNRLTLHSIDNSVAFWLKLLTVTSFFRSCKKLFLH